MSDDGCRGHLSIWKPADSPSLVDRRVGTVCVRRPVCSVLSVLLGSVLFFLSLIHTGYYRKKRPSRETGGISEPVRVVIERYPANRTVDPGPTVVVSLSRACALCGQFRSGPHRRNVLYLRSRSGRLPEEVLFEFERRLDRTEIADYFRTVADSIEGGEAITLRAADESVTLTPPTADLRDYGRTGNLERGRPARTQRRVRARVGGRRDQIRERGAPDRVGSARRRTATLRRPRRGIPRGVRRRDETPRRDTVRSGWGPLSRSRGR